MMRLFHVIVGVAIRFWRTPYECIAAFREKIKNYLGPVERVLLGGAYYLGLAMHKGRHF